MNFARGLNQQVGKSASRQVGESASRQVGMGAHQSRERGVEARSAGLHPAR